jgi:hypothetical protein
MHITSSSFSLSLENEAGSCFSQVQAEASTSEDSTHFATIMVVSLHEVPVSTLGSWPPSAAKRTILQRNGTSTSAEAHIQ